MISKVGFVFVSLVVFGSLVAAMPEFDSSEPSNNIQAKILNSIDKDIEEIGKDFRGKRSGDIDERLMELQAKIALAKEYSKNLVGHGRFNFDEIGKRSEGMNELYRLLLKSREKYEPLF